MLHTYIRMVIVGIEYYYVRWMSTELWVQLSTIAMTVEGVDDSALVDTSSHYFTIVAPSSRQKLCAEGKSWLHSQVPTTLLNMHAVTHHPHHYTRLSTRSKQQSPETSFLIYPGSISRFSTTSNCIQTKQCMHKHILYVHIFLESTLNSTSNDNGLPRNVQSIVRTQEGNCPTTVIWLTKSVWCT